MNAQVGSQKRQLTFEFRGKTQVIDAKWKGESILVISASIISKVMKMHISAYPVFAKEKQLDDIAFSVSNLDEKRTEFQLSLRRSC